MNLDDYKYTLSEKLNVQLAETFSGNDLVSMIETRRHSIFRKIKIFLRIEIIICLGEAISECFHFYHAPDLWAKAYAAINVLIAVLFIFVFNRLIKIINDPANIALPVKENTKLVLSVMKKFYSTYLGFIAFYAFMNAAYYILGVVIEGNEFEEGKELMQVMNKVADPFWRYVLLIGIALVENVLLYLFCRFIIRLFYRKRIKQLQQLANEMEH